MQSQHQVDEQSTKHHNDKEIKLHIKTAQGDWEHSFLRESTISSVIQAVINHFRFAPNGKYELRQEHSPKLPLDPHRTLESYHIKENDCLIFTDLGTGV